MSLDNGMYDQKCAFDLSELMQLNVVYVFAQGLQILDLSVYDKLF